MRAATRRLPLQASSRSRARTESFRILLLATIRGGSNARLGGGDTTERIHLAVASMSRGSSSSRPSRTTWPPPHDDEPSGTWSAGCRRPALLCRPHDLGCFRSSLFGGATEAVLSPLWRNTSNSLSDLAPAGARSPARRGRFLTQPICGASELIGKSQRGQSCLESDGNARDDFVSATLDEPLDQRFQFRVHVPRLPMSGLVLNYVLTTIC